MKLQYHELLSTFAFNLSLRRYILDGTHDIDTNFEVASMVWAETFKYLADNNVQFDRMLLKPSMAGAYTRPLLSST